MKNLTLNLTHICTHVLPHIHKSSTLNVHVQISQTKSVHFKSRLIKTYDPTKGGREREQKKTEATAQCLT